MSKLRHIWHWMSWKPLEIEDWFKRITNRKWPTENRMVTWSMTSRDPERSSRDPNTLRALYLKNSWRCYLVTIANYIVCCEAVQSAILATAWLLVWIWCWRWRCVQMFLSLACMLSYLFDVTFSLILYPRATISLAERYIMYIQPD